MFLERKFFLLTFGSLLQPACAGGACADGTCKPIYAGTDLDIDLEQDMLPSQHENKLQAHINAQTDVGADNHVLLLQAKLDMGAVGDVVTSKSTTAAKKKKKTKKNNKTKKKKKNVRRRQVGLYYSTSTGNTETVAEYIADAAGIEDWKDISDAEDGEIEGLDAIIIGAPTWHTGADQERSGTSWDEWLYDKLPEMDLSGKKVAIFGVGDSGSYSGNYCDAMGELYDQFTARGARVFGMTPSDDGFDYTESKAVVDDKFVGLTFDEDNYAGVSEERAEAWIEQLKSEGFM